MSLTRIHNLSISLDGFATGEPQSAEAPFGHAGERLHEWMFATRFWAKSGGTVGADHAFAERHELGIGAEIMGSNKFGPPGWQDDPGWRGWWGEDPPFHTPAYVLTHRPRRAARPSPRRPARSPRDGGAGRGRGRARCRSWSSARGLSR